jgi:hypothetical protein
VRFPSSFIYDIVYIFMCIVRLFDYNARMFFLFLYRFILAAAIMPIIIIMATVPAGYKIFSLVSVLILLVVSFLVSSFNLRLYFMRSSGFLIICFNLGSSAALIFAFSCVKVKLIFGR